LTPLFLGHASSSRRAAELAAAPPQFGHDAGNLGWSRPVPFLWRISKHFDLVVGKLVEIGFGCLAAFRRWHTLPVWHECVSGSSVLKFKVAHYRRAVPHREYWDRRNVP
jgi:hypothetical protein